MKFVEQTLHFIGAVLDFIPGYLIFPLSEATITSILASATKLLAISQCFTSKRNIYIRYARLFMSIRILWQPEYDLDRKAKTDHQWINK